MFFYSADTLHLTQPMLSNAVTTDLQPEKNYLSVLLHLFYFLARISSDTFFHAKSHYGNIFTDVTIMSLLGKNI